MRVTQPRAKRSINVPMFSGRHEVYLGISKDPYLIVPLHGARAKENVVGFYQRLNNNIIIKCMVSILLCREGHTCLITLP